MSLALFDLDHTLLDGDSDVLWCEFLLDEGVLERASFGPRNREMELQYQAGTVSAQDFCAFYVATLAGRSVAQWEPLRRRFLDEQIAPRLTEKSRALVQRHQKAGDRLVLTTATNRVLTELTAQHLGIKHLIATECEVAEDGTLTGKTRGVLNMREGKVTRMRDWLTEHGQSAGALQHATFYSDSINDLPLLQTVGRPVAVNPDARLAAVAKASHWPMLDTRGTAGVHAH